MHWRGYYKKIKSKLVIGDPGPFLQQQSVGHQYEPVSPRYQRALHIPLQMRLKLTCVAS